VKEKKDRSQKGVEDWDKKEGRIRTPHDSKTMSQSKGAENGPKTKKENRP